MSTHALALLWTPLAFTIIIPALIALSSGQNSISIEASKSPYATIIIYGAIFITTLMIVDTFVGHFFGNTPGKSIMRIHVSEADGSLLTFKRRFQRNIAVAFVGFGCSIPFVTWLFMYLQYYRITRTGKSAFYDTSMGFSITRTAPVALWRVLLCLIFALIGLLLQSICIDAANSVLNPYGWYVGWEAMHKAGPLWQDRCHYLKFNQLGR